MEIQSSQSYGKRRNNIVEQATKKFKKTNKCSSSTGTNCLNGLTLSVSTLDTSSSSNNEVEKTGNSYKEISNLIQNLGGAVSAQVHNRVFGVICNASAVAQSTQRVRKAFKKGIHLIDTEWLTLCKSENKRVDHVPYLLNDLYKKVFESTDQKKNDGKFNLGVDLNNSYDDEALSTDSTIKWSQPIALDCCCVCHDDDRDDCKWCFEVGNECNIIKNKK